MNRSAVLVVLVFIFLSFAGLAAAETENIEHYSIQFTSIPMAQKEEGYAIYERLKAKGYLVYYEKTQIKEKDWMRLKVGVFPTVTKARNFGNEFKQQEGYDFFIANADLRVQSFGSKYEIITTANAVWMKKDGLNQELLLFDPETIESVDVLGRIKTTISPDGGQVICEYGSQNRTIQVKSGRVTDTIPEGDAETYYNQGFSYYKQENLERAAEEFSKALLIDPQHTAAYFYRGLVHYRKGRYDQAIADCTRAVEINPRYSDAYSIRALVWLEKGDLDRAIRDCDRALVINPKDIAAYSTLGVAWLQKGEVEWACSDLKKACELGRCETLATVRKQGYCQ